MGGDEEMSVEFPAFGVSACLRGPNPSLRQVGRAPPCATFLRRGRLAQLVRAHA